MAKISFTDGKISFVLCTNMVATHSFSFKRRNIIFSLKFFPLDNKTFDKNRVSDETVKSLPFLWQSQKKIIGWNRKTLITYCVLNDKKMELRNSLTKRNKIRYTKVLFNVIASSYFWLQYPNDSNIWTPFSIEWGHL